MGHDVQVGATTRIPWTLAALVIVLTGAAAVNVGETATASEGRAAPTQQALAVTVPPGLPSDREALVALYRATDGPNWDRSGRWLTAQPIGLWHGVLTNSAGRVERLELHDNDLRGPIPPELGSLAALTFLELSGNDLDGSIPPELGNLGELRWLDLSDNDLSGPFPPEIGNLAKLDRLLLGDNELDGSIPPEIGSLAALESLDLSFSGLTGPIPREIGKLVSLRYLDLTNMRGTDIRVPSPIPPEMVHLTALEWLDFGPFGDSFLCAPDSPRLLAWLATLNVDLPHCAVGG